MRPFLLTSLTMIAFAANSVLNRLGLAEGSIDPASFAAIRLAAGAIALAVLVQLRAKSSLRAGRGESGGHRELSGLGIGALALYMLGFSFAYVSLDAGTGALLLFGMVQVTMFAGALLAKESVPTLRWVGAGIAFAGLAYLLWPNGQGAPEPLGALLMLAAGLGWGVYSLVGRGVSDPLLVTAINFRWATPIALLVLMALARQIHLTPGGAGLAILSGVVTSGLGYALWYSVLPRLAASVAAIAQLTVPVIAMAGGIVFLGEDLTLRFVLAASLVLGGIALSLLRFKR